ncbi:2-oxo-4-hydroxy-4-carboxy-5-ureidoimidazoline decarboxylase [Parahalioglobus pacificus]|uniref:2-oxo-4-hydroxy-4-carboxy-5-ureidoimidazoline decarboxylase n=1 Tax=Parahalioglobus pacificus TaxID=930806 RepID=A0A918XCC9_9GAMM|nr:2-oxo-4-hydroxy-4-carboxy-5-ureidoimidazoline decarboxylase [Halioglobus pacificus]NQY02098.1 2-oxo-4-hydroxy-4-carboxy-5-ureidoimidazoline decarboxylase [Halieaceae bacterium]GHD25547.1 2-oxo-4-hydroxy-4-carboxy-5-ureidoimidazoline decarboxylase [Halioglobus pacificus]
MNVATLNQASQQEAAQLLRQCCTSEKWISRLLQARPFADAQGLAAAADKAWRDLAEIDYLEAFDGHPKIGDVNSLKAKYANTKALAGGEQSAVDTASDEVLAALAEGNRAYDDKFGFIFIVFATGKSAAEMLELLQARLPNDRDTEMRNAAEEQRKIFQLRLETLL